MPYKCNEIPEYATISKTQTKNSKGDRIFITFVMIF